MTFPKNLRDNGEPSIDQACQHRVDAKAFTGRGKSAKRVRQCEIDLETLHREMSELSETTRKLPGRTFYLAVHRRHRTGQVSLRWRQAGARGGHIPWHDIQALFQRWPEAMARWYIQVQEMALALNYKEQMLRAQLRHADDLLKHERSLLPGRCF